MKQLTMKVITSAVGLLFAATVHAYTINDTYIGSNDHGYGDRIGNSSYEVYGMDVDFSGGMMNVRVHTNFNQSTDPYGIEFGDLFISVDGWNPNGSAPYLSDNAATGESWEFAFDTSLNGLYGGNFSILTSDDKLDASRYIFRNGQEVQRGSGGTLMAGGSSVDLSNAGAGGYVDYSISLAALGLTSDANIGLKWGMTCANDTIEGAVAYNVAEPMSVLLFGIGLLGLGAIRRKVS